MRFLGQFYNYSNPNNNSEDPVDNAYTIRDLAERLRSIGVNKIDVSSQRFIDLFNQINSQGYILVESITDLAPDDKIIIIVKNPLDVSFSVIKDTVLDTNCYAYINKRLLRVRTLYNRRLSIHIPYDIQTHILNLKEQHIVIFRTSNVVQSLEEEFYRKDGLFGIFGKQRGFKDETSDDLQEQ